MVKKTTPSAGVSALSASVALPAAASEGTLPETVVDAGLLGAVTDDNLPGDLAADLVTPPAVVPAFVDGAVAAAAVAGPVALPTSTGDGVVQEVSAVDVLGLRATTNDDAAGDLAAAAVTRPVAVAGAVIEPASPGLGPHPGVNDDLPGDLAARSIVGTDPVPFANTGEGSAGAVRTAPVPLEAETTQMRPATPSALEPAEGTHPDFVVFDLSRPATAEEIANLELVLRRLQRDLGFSGGFTGPDPASPVFGRSPLFGLGPDGAIPQDASIAAIADGSARIRITSKVAGFRRGGIAHPAELVEYRLDVFTPRQLDAILDEPMLVTELV